MRSATVVAGLALCILAAPMSAPAQSSEEIEALKSDINTLRENQQRMERDLTEIKEFLRSRLAAAPNEEPKNLVLSLEGDHVKGDKGARLAFVDFTDYQ